MDKSGTQREKIRFCEVFKDIWGLFVEFWWPLFVNALLSATLAFSAQYLNLRDLSDSFFALLKPVGLGFLFAINASFAIIYIGYRILKKTRDERDTLYKKIDSWDQVVRNTLYQIPSECKLRLSTQLCDIRAVMEKAIAERDIGGVDFIPEHIRHFQQIIDKCKPYSNEIIALDATNEIQWWNNSMIGYLALQSKLRLQRVLRVFVWPRERIISEKGRKLIVFHHFLGFDTYILTPESYDSLLNKFSNEENEAATFDSEFILFGGDMSNVKLRYRGYKSFWQVSATEEERKKLLETSGDVWFDNFANGDEIDFYNKLVKKIEAEARPYNSIADLPNINDVVKGNQPYAIKLQSEDIYDLKMGLNQFGCNIEK